MKIRSIARRGPALAFGLSLFLLGDCNRDKADPANSDQVWAPAKLTSVLGVPEAQIESALKTRLAASRPPRIDADQWGHVRRLYRIYGNNPLWLAPDGLHAQEVIEQMQSGPDDHRVKLPRKIPVYIVYGTAYIRNGQLYFGNDLYDRDDALIEAVAEGALPSPQTIQAVQALRRIAERS
jgi:hypothetical protein